MLAMVLNPQKLARHVGDNVKCDLGSTVARATRLVARASSTTPDGDVRFPSEFFIIAGAFTLGQVLNFGSLAYITDSYGELCPLNGAVPVSNELQVPSPPLGLLGGDLEVLAQQILCGLGLHPIVSNRRHMFYMLANVHHQIAIGEVLPSPNCF
jgi:hypothetical protein